MDVANRVVAITGAARGIGRCTAEAFRAAGARVVIGDIDSDLARTAAESLSSRYGGGVTGTHVDVTDAASFVAFLDYAEAEFGQLDILVNNAGIMPIGAFLDEPESMSARQIAVNVNGVLNGCRLAARRFVAGGAGHIVNVASLAGITGEPGVATYCGTKHFVVGFTEALHRELKPHGVGVTAVLPGFINTELASGTQVPRWAQPLSTAEPEQVAAAIVSAVTKDAARVTVPAALGVIAKVTGLLPSRAKFAVERATGFDRAISGADPAARTAYQRRIAAP